jgi:hypothetical protein
VLGVLSRWNQWAKDSNWQNRWSKHKEGFMNYQQEGMNTDRSGVDTEQGFLALFIGDSLSMPRVRIGIQPEHTYVHSLEMFWRQQYPAAYLWKFLRRGVGVSHFASYFIDSLLPCLDSRQIDVGVVHLGIVDCAPRPLPYSLRLLLSYSYAPLLNAVSRFLHKHRRLLLKAGCSFRFTSPKKFNRVYSNLLNALTSSCDRVYAVNIAPAIETLYEHSPGLRESINEYNDIIQRAISHSKNARLIDVFSEFRAHPDQYLTDDLHINKNGHDWIFAQIQQLELSLMSNGQSPDNQCQPSQSIPS